MLAVHTELMWEDPKQVHKVDKLDRETIRKWLSMSSLSEFNVWHDTNEIIKMLCREILRRMDKDESDKNKPHK